MTVNTLFTEADYVSVHTRTQAIDDCMLYDVTPTAREAGLRLHTAVTAAVWTLIHDIPPTLKGIQDPEGRLWDVLWMARWAVEGSQGLDSKRLNYTLHMARNRNGRRVKLLTLTIHIGPGDDGAPVFTIMLPNED